MKIKEKREKNFSLLVIKCLIFVIILTSFIPTSQTVAYTRAWKFFSQDALEIEINPELSVLKPETNYSFSIHISPLSFNSNQSNFSNIEIHLRLNTPHDTIYSQIKGPYDIDNLSASIATIIKLSVPNESILKLSTEKTESATLEYKLSYDIGFTNGNLTSVTPNWSVINIATINTGSSSNSFIYVVLFISILLTGLTVSIMIRRRKGQ